MCSDWDRLMGNCDDEVKWYEDPKTIGGLTGWMVGGGLLGVAIGGEIGQQIGDTLKPPDYSGPLDAATRQLEEEKRRRATEANRKDARSSQLARLFLSEDGTNFNTPSNSFMG